MLFVVDYDYITGATRTLIILMYLILATGSLIIGLLTLKKSRSEKVIRTYFTYISVFFVGLAIGRYFFIIHDFYTPGSSEIDLTLANILKRCAVVFTITGLTSLTFLIEKQFITKTKKAFTIFGIIVIFAQFTMPFSIAQPIQYIGNPVLTILPFAVYIYLFKTQVGTLKKQSALVLLGMSLLLVSQMGFGLLEDLSIMEQTLTLTIGPPLTLLGLSIIGYAFLRDNKE